MARTVVPHTAHVAGGSTTTRAYAAADAANGMAFPYPVDGKSIFVVKNGDVAAKTVTVKEVVASAAGDLIINVAAGTEVSVGPLESARFKQADGNVYVNFSAATSVTVAAHKLP